MTKLRIFITLFFGICCSALLFAQNPYGTTQDTTGGKIEIIKSDRATYIIENGTEQRYLAGKVRLHHQDAFLLCDSASIDAADNVKAYGDVVIIQDDTVHIFADSMVYNGYIRVADLYGDVILDHGGKKLFTSELNYNLNTKIGTYHTRSTLTDDRTHLSSNRGYYHVNTDEAFFKDSVIVVDPEFSLKTDTLRFNTAENTAYFLAPTLILQDSALIYTNSGYYNIDKREAQFSGRPQYRRNQQLAEADTMFYEGASKVIILAGKAWSKDSIRYASADRIRFEELTKNTRLEGTAYFKDDKQSVRSDTITYNTDSKIFATSGRTRLEDSTQIIEANLLSFDDNTGIGFAEGDVIMTDTVQKTTLMGDRVDYNKKEDFIKASGGRPTLVTLVDNDSMWMRADTIISKKQVLELPPTDTLQVLPPVLDTGRVVLGYRNVRIFAKSFQGECDSIAYSDRDSIFRMIGNPILWSDTTQFTADTIHILTREGSIDRIILIDNAFIVNAIEDPYYNQIKGRSIVAYFERKMVVVSPLPQDSLLQRDTTTLQDPSLPRDSTLGDPALRRIAVEGNAESIYYVLDEQQRYIGVNQIVCSQMLIHFGDNQVAGIRFYTEPKASLTPMRQVNHKTLRLEGYRWEIEKKPLSKLDL